MQYIQFCQVPILIRVPGQCQHSTADQLPNGENKELSIVKMNVWADFSATRKQWLKIIDWLDKFAPG
jgi:hypothetical protein